MPQATIDINETTKVDLLTCPEGYVVLKRMSYGKWLHRQELALKMKITAGQRGSNGDGTTGELDMANRKVTEFEFSECVVDHNLTGPDDSPLDFRKSFTFDMLDPRVGNEIADQITQMHEFMRGDQGNS